MEIGAKGCGHPPCCTRTPGSWVGTAPPVLTIITGWWQKDKVGNYNGRLWSNAKKSNSLQRGGQRFDKESAYGPEMLVSAWWHISFLNYQHRENKDSNFQTSITFCPPQLPAKNLAVLEWMDGWMDGWVNQWMKYAQGSFKPSVPTW